MPRKINQRAKGASGEQLLNLISSSDLTSLLSLPPSEAESPGVLCFPEPGPCYPHQDNQYLANGLETLKSRLNRFANELTYITIYQKEC